MRRGLRLVPVGYPEWLPGWLANVLVLSGVAACLLEGFFDVNSAATADHMAEVQLIHPFDMGAAGLLVQELGVALRWYLSWPLFLWFCALIATLQYYILVRNHARRAWKVASLSFICISIVLVVMARHPDFLGDFMRWVGEHLHLPSVPAPDDHAYAIFWTIVNFGVLTYYVLNVVRRWRRRLRGESLDPFAGITLEGESHPSAASSTAQTGWRDVVGELLAFDLLGGGILALVLAAVFLPPLWGGVVGSDRCPVSLPIGNCPPGTAWTGVADPHTLTFSDLIIAIIGGGIGVLLLFTLAARRGVEATGDFREAGGTAANGALEQTVTPLESAQGSFDAAWVAAESLVAPRGEPRTVAVSAPAAPTSTRGLVSSIALSLRQLIWPAFTFLAVACASGAASFIQFYLALLDLQHQHGAPFDADWRNFVVVPLALALIAAAAVLSVFSAATLVFSTKIVGLWLQRLWPIALLVLNLFWGFGVALLLLNLLVWLLAHAFQSDPQVQVRLAFFPPGLAVYVSFVAFVLYRYGLRRTPREAPRRTPEGPPATA